MPIHDAYPRRTPLEVAFPEPEDLDRFVRGVEEEAGAREVDAGAPGSFVALGVVATRLREATRAGASGAEVVELGQLLFHVAQTLRADGPLVFVDTAAARRLVEDRGWRRRAERWSVKVPARAGYVQLPRHLFWLEGRGAEAAEPIDGFFWTVAGPDVLHVLVVSGLWEGREGFRVAALPEAPLAEAAAWLSARVREGEEDFATTLPGGDLEGLYSIVRAGEVLKLAARLFHTFDAHPGWFTACAAPVAEDAALRPRDHADGPHPVRPSPAPTRLAYLRLKGEE